MASNSFKFVLGATKTPSPYSSYLNILSQWSTAPALATMWFVTFNIGSVPALLNNPALQVSDLDSGDFLDWNISQSTVGALLSPELQHQTQNLLGCVFAQQVTIPGESVAVSQKGLQYAGFMTPNIADQRTLNNKIGVTFMETNASFSDLIIRPWLILVSHYGLIARSPDSVKNVKCNYMDVVQFAKTGPSVTATIRKIIRYWNVVPTNLNSTTLSQAEEGIKRTDVTFAFDGYTVFEAGTYNIV